MTNSLIDAKQGLLSVLFPNGNIYFSYVWKLNDIFKKENCSNSSGSVIYALYINPNAFWSDYQINRQGNIFSSFIEVQLYLDILAYKNKTKQNKNPLTSYACFSVWSLPFWSVLSFFSHFILFVSLFPCAFFFLSCISLSTTHSDYHINVVCSELIKMLHLPLFPSSLGHFYQLPLYFYKWNGNVYSVQSCQMCSFQIKVILEATHKSLNSPGMRAAETFLSGCLPSLWYSRIMGCGTPALLLVGLLDSLFSSIHFWP